MKKTKEVLTTLVMLSGLLIAAITGNTGNVFIFTGLYLVTLGTQLDKKGDTPWYKVLGVMAYVVGAVWAGTLGNIGLALGWGSVFLTLIITTIEAK